MNAIIQRGAVSGNEKNHRERAGWRRQIFRLGVALALTLATVASAQTYTVLKSFTGSDGCGRKRAWSWRAARSTGRRLVESVSDNGVVFKMNMDGSGYAVLKSFTGSDGSWPYAGVVLAGNTLYGTTTYGGSGGDYGDGVVFKVNTDGSGYAVLKNFIGSDGSRPQAELVLAGNTLYGTTANGGTSGNGVIFKVNLDGSGYTVLKNFTRGADGALPLAGLVLAGSTLYGTAVIGGSSGSGVIFKVNTDGSGYTVLKSFTGSDGSWPQAGLVLAGSTFYGTTLYGGSSTNGGMSTNGVIFKINTDGSGYTVLKEFTGSEGQCPEGDLAFVGSTLYGTTWYGGSSGNGVVFKVNTDGSGYTVLKSLTGRDGTWPQAGVVLAGSTLYGTTEGGGDFSYGVVFSLRLSPPSVTKQPLTQTAETGTTPWFSVEVTNALQEATYQWYFNGTNALGGATNAFVQLTNVQPVQAGAYTVVVTNLVGAVTSAPALLSVIPPVVRTVVPAVHLLGGTGSFLHLEYADSLAAPQWSSFTNVTLASGPQLCFDLSQPLPPQRFYRTWQTNGPQPALDMSLATEIPLTGGIGSSVRVDYINAIGPTDAWVTLNTVLLTNTTQLYFDDTAFRQPTRLYRLVPVP